MVQAGRVILHPFYDNVQGYHANKSLQQLSSQPLVVFSLFHPNVLALAVHCCLSQQTTSVCSFVRAVAAVSCVFLTGSGLLLFAHPN
jgi:hypothetical protein